MYYFLFWRSTTLYTLTISSTSLPKWEMSTIWVKIGFLSGAPGQCYLAGQGQKDRTEQ